MNNEKPKAKKKLVTKGGRRRHEKRTQTKGGRRRQES
jgi:hypothetical protein